MKNVLHLLAIDAIVSILYSIINKFSTYSFLNCAFIVGMIYFLFGLLCFVWEKGFFNITLFSFNKISQQFQRRKGILPEDNNITIEDYICRQNSFHLTNSLLISGLLISITSIGISFIVIS
ncbi:DUF3899 domain-containing protein [[Clostridium] dakarense]|uniref:DUF3899 domain-containing protein n=1 Tax=Faecalimicrobium dakarense TaxID=1301100 RepID=UPI0004B0C1CE